MQGLWLLLFGIVVGVFGGLFGIGGGLIMVPGLMLFFGLTQQQAQGTSVAVMIPPIGLGAALLYYHAGHIKLPIVGWVAAGFFIGAIIGGALIDHIPANGLKVAFGLVLLYQGFNFVMYPGPEKRGAVLPALIATLFAGAIAWVLRKQNAKGSVDAGTSDDDIEFHI